MKPKIICGIYAIRLNLDGRAYIGSSNNINTRWFRHRRELAKGSHHCQYLQNAWNKHGEKSFNFIIIEECAQDELYLREQFYFDNTISKFNCAPVAGSPRGLKRSEETRKKMSLWQMTPIIHGTVSGYKKELRRGLIPCKLCTNANSNLSFKAYSRKGFWPKKTEAHKEKISLAKLKPIAHGTVNGYSQERNRGLPYCSLCKESVRIYAKNRRKQRLKEGSIA